DETGTLRLKKVFNPIILETKGGESLCVCMRDTGFEVTLRDMGGVAKSYTMSSVGINHLNPQTRKLARWWCDTCDNSFVGMNGHSDTCPVCNKRTRKSVSGNLRVANSVLLNYKVIEE
ncbi:MAG: hypothetical protein KAS32_28730, partial [Candidatus Peribacteraceae bacterium]|nr:hypothetical protein [Candidatus Peribacteraceae bacterium]